MSHPRCDNFYCELNGACSLCAALERIDVLELPAQNYTSVRLRAEKAEAFLEREGYRSCDTPACNCGSWHDHKERALRLTGALEALRLILFEPYGCPSCDSGSLYEHCADHWGKCGFARAVEVIEANTEDDDE